MWIDVVKYCFCIHSRGPILVFFSRFTGCTIIPIKADFYIFARYIYADIAVVHLELLSIRPYAIFLPLVPDSVWNAACLSIVPYECVVLCILNILLYGSEILFNILDKDTVAVYIFGVSTPKFCRGVLVFSIRNTAPACYECMDSNFSYQLFTFFFFWPLLKIREDGENRQWSTYFRVLKIEVVRVVTLRRWASRSRRFEGT